MYVDTQNWRWQQSRDDSDVNVSDKQGLLIQLEISWVITWSTHISTHFFFILPLSLKSWSI